MASNLRGPDLFLGGAPRQGRPADYVRKQKAQTHNGVGASFIDARPRGGVVILQQQTANVAKVDKSRSLYNTGLVSSLPAPKAQFRGRKS